VLLLVGALVAGMPASSALAEPLVRGPSAAYDIALVDPDGDAAEFTVIFDAAVAPDGSSVVVGQFGGKDLRVGSGDGAVILEPFDQPPANGMNGMNGMEPAATDENGPVFLPTGFVARFDAALGVVWAVRFPGAATGVAIDGDGSIGVTGSFSGEATFGTTTLESNGEAAAFLARYQPDGTLDWAVQAGGPTDGFLPFGCSSPRDIGLAVAFGQGGALYMGGGVTGEAVFSAAEGSPQTVQAAASNVNGFVAQYSSAGAVVRVTPVASAADSLVNGVATGPNGSVAITGLVRGSGTIGGASVTAAGGTDAFVALLGAGGDATWLAQVGGSASERPESPVCGPGQTTTPAWPTDVGVGVNVSGGSVVALVEAVGSTTLTDAGGDPIVLAGSDADDQDLIVVRYDVADGGVQWATRVTSPEEMLGGAVLATEEGGAVATGYFRSAAAFGPLALTGSGATTMFVAGFGSEGAVVWADALDTSGDGFSVGFGLARTGAGGVFAVGKTTASPERAIRVQYVEEAGAPSAVAPGTSIALACTPETVRVGQSVTCTVTGGDPGIDILWRAAYSPVFAEAGVTLDDSGTGQFSFVVPTAALGQEVTVELVEWLPPLSLGVVGGPVPSSVPSGEGPVPVWPLVMLALAGGLVLRRMSTVSVRG
jgi:hypothetical protein